MKQISFQQKKTILIQRKVGAESVCGDHLQQSEKMYNLLQTDETLLIHRPITEPYVRGNTYIIMQSYNEYLRASESPTSNPHMDN